MSHRLSQKSIFDPLDPTVLIYHFESGGLNLKMLDIWEAASTEFEIYGKF